MNPRDTVAVINGTYISPAQAAEVIRLLRAVDAQLAANFDQDGGALSMCISFTKDAVWAAAFPDDSLDTLDRLNALGSVATQAENAMG